MTYISHFAGETEPYGAGAAADVQQRHVPAVLTLCTTFGWLESSDFAGVGG